VPSAAADRGPRASPAPLRLAIIADTHLPRGARELPRACVAELRAADLILHAGDLSTLGVLARLEALGPPVAAVQGNVDDEEVVARLPVQRVVEAAGARIGMVHDAGRAAGRLARLARRFPDADAVVFGHSHVPLHERDAATGFQIFNPGSPTERRRQPRHTMGLACVQDGAVRFQLIDLD
jgi:putative phosphoesterase